MEFPRYSPRGHPPRDLDPPPTRARRSTATCRLATTRVYRTTGASTPSFAALARWLDDGAARCVFGAVASVGDDDASLAVLGTNGGHDVECRPPLAPAGFASARVVAAGGVEVLSGIDVEFRLAPVAVRVSGGGGGGGRRRGDGDRWGERRLRRVRLRVLPRIDVRLERRRGDGGERAVVHGGAVRAARGEDVVDGGRLGRIGRDAGSRPGRYPGWRAGIRHRRRRTCRMGPAASGGGERGGSEPRAVLGGLRGDGSRGRVLAGIFQSVVSDRRDRADSRFPAR